MSHRPWSHCSPPATRKGDCRYCAGAKIEVIWPETDPSDAKCLRYQEVQLARHSDYHISLSELAEMPLLKHDTSQSNKNSLVFTFEFENHRLLFTGDAWAEDVVKAQGTYDLVKIPHHGSAKNISKAYPESIQCTNFLMCTDGVNHPDKQTIAKLERWYGKINIYSPSAWWKNGYFIGNDKQHEISYCQKEGLVITW